MAARTLVIAAAVAGGCGSSHDTVEPIAPVCSGLIARSASWTAADGFCRDVTTRGITLVDWDGHLANPAIAIAIAPPQGVSFPVTLSVTANEPRIYWDRGSRDASVHDPYDAPADTHTFNDATPVVFRIAIWPDDAGVDETYTLTLSGDDITTDVPVHVIGQDLNTPISYPFNVDFSHDQVLPDGTQLFADAAKQAVVVQAANDWAYFFDGTGLDPIAAGQETTQIDSANGWYGPRATITNASPYTGYLLYATGVHTQDVRSTGFPTTNQVYESKGGQVIPGNLYRSGALEVEEVGNWSSAGWFVSTSNETWYMYDNEGTTVSDLASIVHHEMGHALFFCGAPACPGPGYARFASGSGASGNTSLYSATYDGNAWGVLTSPAIRAYYAADADEPVSDGAGTLPVDFRNHFAKLVNAGPIDPASGLGAFGTEYANNGVMPRRRWIITKLDLLAAQAIGYPLRTNMSPFVPLALASSNGVIVLAGGQHGSPYAASLSASGGVPTYNFTVEDGAMPAGLELDSFAGTIAGTPTRAGSFELTVQVEDSLGAKGTSRVQIAID